MLNLHCSLQMYMNVKWKVSELYIITESEGNGLESFIMCAKCALRVDTVCNFQYTVLFAYILTLYVCYSAHTNPCKLNTTHYHSHGN